MEHSEFITILNYINYIIGTIIIVGTLSSAIFDVYQFSRAESVIMIALAWIIIVKYDRTGGDKNA